MVDIDKRELTILPQSQMIKGLKADKTVFAKVTAFVTDEKTGEEIAQDQLEFTILLKLPVKEISET